MRVARLLVALILSCACARAGEPSDIRRAGTAQRIADIFTTVCLEAFRNGRPLSAPAMKRLALTPTVAIEDIEALVWNDLLNYLEANTVTFRSSIG
jgi:hypothetical protein